MFTTCLVQAAVPVVVEADFQTRVLPLILASKVPGLEILRGWRLHQSPGQTTPTMIPTVTLQAMLEVNTSNEDWNNQVGELARAIAKATSLALDSVVCRRIPMTL